MVERGGILFGLFKKKENKLQIGAPLKGMAIPLQEVSDPTFGEGILGNGMAIQPEEGKIYAPVDGDVTLLFDTLHAVSITSEDDVEILVHIGLDTVVLKGEHFIAHTQTGAKVKKGDLLLEVDLEQVKAAGYDVVTPIIICNTSDYEAVEAVTGNVVAPGDVILEITKK